MPKSIDLTGQKFSRLKVIKQIDERKNGGVVWECECECGNRIQVITNALKSNHTKSCGCLKEDHIIDLINKNEKYFISDTNIVFLKITKPNKNSTTKYRGVSYNKNAKKYHAKIGFKKVRYYLGSYNSAEEAYAIYQIVKENLHKDFIEWYDKKFENKESIMMQ